MHSDILILGAGAAGLMCAIEAGKRGRSVVVLEHNTSVGEKIRVSGGGRCNFTNTNAGPENYLSSNPEFCRSALARYTPSEFVSLIERHGIGYREKKLGQLFCDGSAQQIIDLLLKECAEAGVRIQTGIRVDEVKKEGRFTIRTSGGHVESESLVVATGGLSVPKLGASDLGYRIARQFALRIVDPRPGLVPFVFNGDDWKRLHQLSGVSLDAEVSCGAVVFRENILFTHRGLSGPAILQASSYWKAGDAVTINLLPGIDVEEYLKTHRATKKELRSVLESVLPSRFVRAWLDIHGGGKPMNMLSAREIAEIAESLTRWRIVPGGVEGYSKAEVTVGGVDTSELSSKTLGVRSVPGLYFIGEVVDVTGWLGGYNFQWAWASGWAAGQDA